MIKINFRFHKIRVIWLWVDIEIQLFFWNSHKTTKSLNAFFKINCTFMLLTFLCFKMEEYGHWKAWRSYSIIFNLTNGNLSQSSACNLCNLLWKSFHHNAGIQYQVLLNYVYFCNLHNTVWLNWLFHRLTDWLFPWVVLSRLVNWLNEWLTD